MAINKRLEALGVAKQAAQGTPTAEPAYGFGLISGAVFGLALEQAVEALSGGTSRVSQDVDRTGIRPGFTFATRVYPELIPLLMYLVLGAKAVIGSGAPFTHTDTEGTPQPWSTWFGKIGTNYVTIYDAKMRSLKLSWTRGALLLEGVVEGCHALFGEPAYTLGLDLQGHTRFSSFGGTYQLDAADDTPADARVISGSLEIANSNFLLEDSADIEPADITEGELVITPSLTIAPNDLAEYRKILTGSGTGTTPTGVPSIGSFNLLWAIDANTDLHLSAAHWATMCDFPDVDPKGGYAEFPISGQLVGTDFAAVTRNAIASY